MRQARILGCRVDAVGADEAVRHIVTLAQGSGTSTVVTLGTEMVVAAQRDPTFREAINRSALVLCDTIGVLAAVRLQGIVIPQRVTGIDLIDPLCAALASAHLPLFVLGGKDDTAERAAATLRTRHPGLIVAGTHDGYFAPADDEAVARELSRSGARVVLAGLGSPRQERWLDARLKETGCAVGIGVGGSLDVLAGNVERAPARWRRLNLEWLYRLVREPQRWRRQLALPIFVFLVLREYAGTRFARRSMV